MPTRKAVRLRRCQVEKWHRTRAFERELESDIQQCCSDHRDCEKFRFTTQFLQCKLHDNKSCENGQCERGSDKREAAHDHRERGRSELMDCRPGSFVKLSRI